MSETTLATAKKCPKCNQVGEQVGEAPTSDPKYTGYVFTCLYKLCVWFETNWIVTVDEDGKVPVRDTGHIKKSFPALPEITPEQRKQIRENFDDV